MPRACPRGQGMHTWHSLPREMVRDSATYSRAAKTPQGATATVIQSPPATSVWAPRFATRVTHRARRVVRITARGGTLRGTGVMGAQLEDGMRGTRTMGVGSGEMETFRGMV